MTLSPDGLTDATAAVAERLAAADPRLLALALALHVANHLLRSIAWRNVLAAAYPASRIGLVRVTAAYAAGVAVNAVAPARGGDAVKVALARGAIPGSRVATIVATMSVLVAFDMVLATALVLGVGLAGALPLDPAAAARGLPVPLAVGLAALAAGLAWAAGRLARRRLAALWAQLRQGGAILRRPHAYARAVALPQIAAWCCRIAVVLCLLAAFGLPASVPLAGLVMVLTGASTIVPLTPGGAGTQQVVLAFALSQAASATAVVSFSLGMQASVTAVNALLGIAGAMAMYRTLRPVTAVRAALAGAQA
jgi:uncharacterized membrane protein YbhN (UPF0104 family)